MCNKVVKIYQQSFSYEEPASSTVEIVSHRFNRIYKTKKEQFFKIKCVTTNATQILLLSGLSQINGLCNYENIDVTGNLGSFNHFYLGNSSNQCVPEIIIDEIPLSNFNIINTEQSVLEDYHIVFQIELWE